VNSGVTPLVMHNGRGADPTNPAVIELKKLTASEEDQRYLRKDQVKSRLGYYDDKIGPYIAEVIEAMIANAGKQKQGALVGFLADPEKIRFIRWPRT
jgi:hypothetical protein